MPGKDPVILDTCVLINFAAIGRLDLLTAHPDWTFLVTEHVRDEVNEHYADQFDAVRAAVADGTLAELRGNSPEELDDFARLSALRSLGDGECSAIAAAKHRALPLVIDDRSVRNKAQRFHHAIQLLQTQDVFVGLIRGGVLTVEEADGIRLEWENQHRFKLLFASFGDILA